MARKYTLGGKAPQAGNKVSHAHNKTRRKWMPNIQTKTLFSAALNRSVRLTISTRELRTLDDAGGLDGYLINASAQELSGTMRRLQTLIKKRTVAAT